MNIKQIKIAVVVSLFNDFITKRLLEGCLKQLKKDGVAEKNILIEWVPGALEIPVTAQKLAGKKDIQAVICLGAVIRGDTFHFEVVSLGAAQGVMQASLSTQKPIIFGVLTTDTTKQAYSRSELKKDNKGRDAAQAALHMINVLSKIK
jgi:6,7-dimethyl-8-ribityllumazine synthase